MKTGSFAKSLIVASVAVSAVVAAQGNGPASGQPFSDAKISTIPLDKKLTLRSATYSASGKVLVSYADKADQDRRYIKLAVMDDDGRNLHPFFAQAVPVREKDNGLRFMTFPDDKRIFLGDFIVECAQVLERCANPKLVPVDYPAEIADGDHVAHRWSEMVVSPDNRHVSWTTLLSNFSALVFVGELKREAAAYRIVNSRIVSTLDPFAKDPAHADGVLPKRIAGGEVKQFVHGGTALSLAGAVRRDIPDSVVLDLATGRTEAVTDTPGYTETTIFSPDERLGVTMTTRFSERTDPAVLGLLPRPYPDSLNMSLSMFAYTYAVTGVRSERLGNVGPALIDIQASSTQDNYLGRNLNVDADWVFNSPLSWHSGGKKAMWIESLRGSGRTIRRMRMVDLPGYRPGPTVAARPLPVSIPGVASNLSIVKGFASASQNIDVKVYGRKSGYLTFRRTPDGLIEKNYKDFSDDGHNVYSGSERMQANPRGQSTYVAKITLSGPKPGAMDLKITFGPLGGKLPAQIISSPDSAGVPLSHGYAEYDGRRIDVSSLLP